MKTIDLFSGCGGLSLGFQEAGFEIVAAFDNWDACINVYRENFRHPIFQQDLTEDYVVDLIKKYEPEVLIGGAPCQDFSSAGKRNENLGRANLTVVFCNIILAVCPKLFVMENVDRIIKSSTFNLVKSKLSTYGYGLTSIILNAAYCGVPQQRKRHFLIGHLTNNDNFLDFYLTKNLSLKPMSLYDYLGVSLGVEHYYRHPRSYQRRGVFSIYEPSPTIRGINRPIPASYQFHPKDSTLDRSSFRPLTTIERSYIQTFPKSFIFNGTKTDIEQMIGNAVPVKLAKYVGNCIMEYLKNCNGHYVEKQMLQLELL